MGGGYDNILILQNAKICLKEIRNGDNCDTRDWEQCNGFLIAITVKLNCLFHDFIFSFPISDGETFVLCAMFFNSFISKYHDRLSPFQYH